MKCCNKPKFKLEKSEKLRDYKDTRVSADYPSKSTAYIAGELINTEYQRYMIFCENCGHLERKGEM